MSHRKTDLGILRPKKSAKVVLGLVIIICLGERDVLVTIPADALHINPGTFPVQRAVVEMVSLQIDRSLTGRAAILALILS